MTSAKTEIREFLETHPVFTLEELRQALSVQRSSRAASDMIQHNKSMGRVGMIKEVCLLSVCRRRPDKELRFNSKITFKR